VVGDKLGQFFTMPSHLDARLDLPLGMDSLVIF